MPKKDKRDYPKPGTPGVVDLGDGRRAFWVAPKFGRWRRYQMFIGAEMAAAKSGNMSVWAQLAQEKHETVLSDCVIKLEGFEEENDAGKPISTVAELLEFSADTDAIITIFNGIFAETPLGASEKKSSGERSGSSEAETDASTGTTPTPSSPPSEDAAPAA